MKYILASSSPRRKKLMEEISSDFLIDVSEVDETIPSGYSPIQAVEYLAHKKGEVVHNRHYDDLVISADTIVVFNNEIIGKPKDEDDTRRILKELSGNKHYVYTGCAFFYKENVHVFNVKTDVYFCELDDELIEKYIASKSPLDKAGAYGIQDNDVYHLIDHIDGDLNNVIGFPTPIIKEELKEFLNKIAK